MLIKFVCLALLANLARCCLPGRAPTRPISTNSIDSPAEPNGKSSQNSPQNSNILISLDKSASDAIDILPSDINAINSSFNSSISNVTNSSVSATNNNGVANVSINNAANITEATNNSISNVAYISSLPNSSISTKSFTNTSAKLQMSNEITEKPLICYYGTWAVYRPGDGKFNVEDIDPFVCTHIVYAFTGLNYNGEIVPLDAWNDLPDNYGKNAFGRFNALKKKNEKLKTILAIGGWNEGSIKYSSMAKSEATRKTFAKSVVNMLEKYGFDGLDMDWEYPANRGGSSADKENYVKLLADLKEAFQPKGFLLTAAVSAGFWTIDTAYNIPLVSKYLDYINVMAYDFHGAWDQKTGHNSPLYARPDETSEQTKLNVDFAINYWIKNGAAKEKIILGMATYGRTFSLANSQNTGYNAPITGPGAAGPYTREPSTLGYNEFCEQQMNPSTRWNVVQDDKAKVPYAYRGNQWIGYDDIQSINEKARYVYEKNLAGAMIWSIETDDFRGKCGQGAFPLLASIRKGLSGQVVQNPPETTVTTTTSTTQLPSSSTTSSSSSSSSTASSTPSSSSSSSQSTTDSYISISTSTVDPRSGSSSTAASTDPDKFVCQSEGFFKGKDCSTFYRCVFVGDFGEDGQKYRVFEYHCPSGTVYDPQTSLCVWPSAVPGCENYHK